MKGKNEKEILVHRFLCPGCKKKYIMTIKDIITKQAVKAEKTRKTTLELDNQKMLNEVK